jgi:hypothetical protein
LNSLDKPALEVRSGVAASREAQISEISNADNAQVANMHKTLRMIVVGLATLLLASVGVQAEEVSREQIKGLDEQVQDIKSDVLSIAADLNRLEEKLLYPSHTQVAVFLSLQVGETFRLDSVELELEGEPVAHHLYSFKELDALRRGGVQRLYTGNVRTGEHELRVTFLGKTAGGSELQRTESHQLHKDVGPGLVEISLAQQSITFKDR